MSSRNNVVWLRIETALAVHEAQVTEHGGIVGIRDRGLLESALERPRMLAAYGSPSIPEIAARYALAIVRNHPFFDGNKRVGLVALAVFLALNGWRLVAADDACVANILLLAASEHTDETFAAWVLGACAEL